MSGNAGRATGADDAPGGAGGAEDSAGRAGGVAGALWTAQGIPAPARRALVDAGILTVEDLRATDPDALARLHGMGPKALALLRPLRDG